MAKDNMMVVFNVILLKICQTFCRLHSFLYHHQPSRPICLFVFFQYPMELSILVVMQICIKMGPINSQLLVYHHSQI